MTNIENLNTGGAHRKKFELTRQHVLRGIFGLVIALCCGIFILMIMGVRLG
jgi:hypothetical protein